MENNKNKNNVHPKEFLCSLTGELMNEPMSDEEGNNYEKKEIVEWLSRNSVSPVSGSPLHLDLLKENKSLRELIEEYRKGLPVENANANANSEVKIEAIKSSYNSNTCTLISLIPAQSENIRSPTNVCCVIDISGSMGGEAKIKTDSAGAAEGFGFSILDLVKHAVKTMIMSLDQSDNLSIVSYHSTVKVELELTKMDEAGRKEAESVLQKLRPEDNTNLWGGLEKGLEVMRNAKLNNANLTSSNSAIFLLTDGLPNVIPPRGHIPMLKKYLKEKGLPAIINTFGFGYNLDSQLLVEIAKEGKGTFAFIPDGSFVGTIFVNALSNLLTTVATEVSLKLSCPKDKFTIKDFSLLSDHFYNFDSSNNTLEIRIGSITQQQQKNFLLPIIYDSKGDVEINPQLQIDLEYKTVLNETISKQINVEVKEDNESSLKVIAHYYRLTFINKVLSAMSKYNNDENEAKLIIKTFIEELETSPIKDDTYIKDLLKDLTEQVSIAFSKQEYYKKWGVHYLPSLTRSHLLQICNNFKDPGVQHFGGEAFLKIRDQIDDIFLNLPPPEPSIKNYNLGNNSYGSNLGNNSYGSNLGNNSYGSNQPCKIAMSLFYDSNNTCFDGDCFVTMADGSNKLVKDLKKNDVVLSAYNKHIKVVCSVKTVCTDSKAELVQFENGLKVTPWHPIKLEGKFVFPCNVSTVGVYECPAVYSFVLEGEHIIRINNVECITLGHNLKDGILNHPYFGSEKVIADLKKLEGWGEGQVILYPNYVKRNPFTNLIDRIVKV